MERKVLVVDDEKLIVKGIKFSLEQDGFKVDAAYDGEEALRMIREGSYDIVFLDVMLPKMNGYEVCQQVREFSMVPIIMLTAKSDDMDKILGLEYGADDYITKPFNILEVKARMKAVFRRTGSGETEEPAAKTVSLGDFVLDCDSRKDYLKSRCPMNLVTVMLKKDDVMKVGGYQDWYCEEDYYLWIRLAQNGYKFYNIQENLVDVRVGEEMYQRRGGWKYFKSEAKLQRYMLKHGVISLPKYLYNVLLRFAVQVMMPNKVRGWVFQKFARK